LGAVDTQEIIDVFRLHIQSRTQLFNRRFHTRLLPELLDLLAQSRKGFRLFNG
jgi:hypothetical protein